MAGCEEVWEQSLSALTVLSAKVVQFINQKSQGFDDEINKTEVARHKEDKT